MTAFVDRCIERVLLAFCRYLARRERAYRRSF